MSDIHQVASASVDSLPVAPGNAQANELPSPSVPQGTPGGRGRASSRVTMGYFDREGVDQLRHTLTRLSEAQVAQSLSMETISVPATGPFDLEKTLRTIMRKCVMSS